MIAGANVGIVGILLQLGVFVRKDVQDMDTPIFNSICYFCEESITELDMISPTRIYDAYGIHRRVHSECMLREVAGHVFGGCHCFMPGASIREQARVAWDNCTKASL